MKLAIGSCSGKESRHIEYMKVDLSRMQKESDALIGRVGAPVVQCLRLRTRHLVSRYWNDSPHAEMRLIPAERCCPDGSDAD